MVFCSVVDCGDKAEPTGHAASGASAGPVRRLKDLGEAKAALHSWQQAPATRAVLEASFKANPTWADQVLDGEFPENIEVNSTEGDRGLYIPLHRFLSKSAIERHLDIVACAIAYGEVNSKDFSELDVLLSKKPNLNAPMLNTVNSPLSSVRSTEALKRLIDAGIDVNRPLGSGKNKLAVATAANNLPLMQMLKDHGGRE